MRHLYPRMAENLIKSSKNGKKHLTDMVLLFIMGR